MTTPHASPHTTPNAAMVHGQLRPGRIIEPRLLAATEATDRAAFVPPAQMALAYTDAPVPLAPGREMLPPLVQAHLLQGVALQPGGRVLVLAAGTGYLAALAAALVGPTGRVVAVEDDAELVNVLRANLANYNHVEIIPTNPAAGHAAAAPYDGIVLDAIAAQLPASLTAQLAPGGRLAAVLVGPDGLPEVSMFTPTPTGMVPTTLFETAGPIHPAFAKAPGFVF